MWSLVFVKRLFVCPHLSQLLRLCRLHNFRLSSGWLGPWLPPGCICRAMGHPWRELRGFWSQSLLVWLSFGRGWASLVESPYSFEFSLRCGRWWNRGHLRAGVGKHSWSSKRGNACLLSYSIKAFLSYYQLVWEIHVQLHSMLLSASSRLSGT